MEKEAREPFYTQYASRVYTDRPKRSIQHQYYLVEDDQGFLVEDIVIDRKTGERMTDMDGVCKSLGEKFGLDVKEAAKKQIAELS